MHQTEFTKSSQTESFSALNRQSQTGLNFRGTDLGSQVRLQGIIRPEYHTEA